MKSTYEADSEGWVDMGDLSILSSLRSKPRTKHIPADKSPINEPSEQDMMEKINSCRDDIKVCEDKLSTELTKERLLELENELRDLTATKHHLESEVKSRGKKSDNMQKKIALALQRREKINGKNVGCT